MHPVYSRTEAYNKLGKMRLAAPATAALHRHFPKARISFAAARSYPEAFLLSFDAKISELADRLSIPLA